MSGTITASASTPRDPESYGTSLLPDVNTGATIGFQLDLARGRRADPLLGAVRSQHITPGAAYVARGSVWDGTTLWNTPAGVPVITNDNPKSNVLLTVVPAVTPTPARARHRAQLGAAAAHHARDHRLIVGYAYYRSKRPPPIVPPWTRIDRRLRRRAPTRPSRLRRRS